MDMFIVLVAAAGITFALQNKIPFIHKKAAFVDSMLKCTFCSGFHGGWLAYLLFAIPAVKPQMALLYAFASAIFSYALDEGIKALEEYNYGDGSD